MQLLLAALYNTRETEVEFWRRVQAAHHLDCQAKIKQSTGQRSCWRLAKKEADHLP